MPFLFSTVTNILRSSRPSTRFHVAPPRDRAQNTNVPPARAYQSPFASSTNISLTFRFTHPHHPRTLLAPQL
ncbi:hypothetical protein MPTK1_3g06000 [Marchantia polymorpha subsp. ruderalis]|uniref:Uncharacterized protein n=2 Tax=Marchantia polymorpha TaxID=3197 RepID=A0AAF6AXW1_MARPO|nr:hypothetical protein MARPO_0006s0070 [Marchantia polymorpha]BBN04595.1 hypothetical protein Mp_3g06000 [Marchantia polymorpha subsp. ruderalis]|eukprot:PTQ48031.1 hypothetical protein MARPO_0006s0070 [Marchantia polymorpha]